MKIISARLNVPVVLFSLLLGLSLMSAPPLNADNNNPNSIQVNGVDVSLSWPLYFPTTCSSFPVTVKNLQGVEYLRVTLTEHTDKIVAIKNINYSKGLSASQEDFSFLICHFDLRYGLGPYKLKVYLQFESKNSMEDSKEIFFNRSEEDAAAIATAKKLTITCVKGKLVKKITGNPPKCPKGYTTDLTVKAFYDCQLDKRDALIGTATLKDAGKTLTFSSVGKYGGLTGSATYSDVECALKIMKAQSFVKDQINTTRALDGMQKATWGKISAFWTYHPDNGLNISFNSK